MREFVDCSDQGFALLRRTDQINHKLAVFVHGFGGTHLTTWGDLASCLSEHSESEAPLDGWDYLFFGYSTPHAPSLLSISRRLASCIKQAVSGDEPFEHSYERFSLFGHSLGTLAIRQLLCITDEHPHSFADSLHSVVLFASPVEGSWLANWASLNSIRDAFSDLRVLVPGSYKVADSLKPDGMLIDMLKTWYETMRSHVSYPGVLIVQGSDDKVLGYGAEKWRHDERLEVPSGHIAMTKVKLANWQASFMRARLKAALK